MKLRVLESQWAPFVGALCARQEVETAGVILAEQLHGGDVLLAKQLLAVPDNGYAVRRIDQLRIDPVAFNRLIRPARDTGLSVLTIHTHPGSIEPWFSHADDLGDSRLMPSRHHALGLLDHGQ
jgi:proteasome lid subunit RPN8/RPN11